MRRTSIIGPLVACTFVVIQFVPSYADPVAYCTAFARDLADRKLQTATNEPATDSVGTSGLEGADPARVDEAVGSVSVPASDVELPGNRWRRSYSTWFNHCMDQYGLTVHRPAAKQIKKRGVTKSAAAPTPGSPAWTEYCRSKHPSFEPKTGTYQTVSGKQRKCTIE